MNKKFINGFLLASLVVGTAGSLSSCKDYDDDINQLRTEVAQNKSAIDDINSKIANGAILTGVTSIENGIRVSVEKDGKPQTYDILNGAKGEAGAAAPVWSIKKGTAGDYTWFEGDKDTGLSAQGPQGLQGVQGNPGAQGAPGDYWAPNEDGSALVEHVWDAELNDGKGGYKETTNIKEIAIKLPDGTKKLTAVLDNDYLYLNGVDGQEGAVVISRNGYLKGLVFKPQVYLDGVEAALLQYTKGTYLAAVKNEVTGNVTSGTATLAYKIPLKINNVDVTVFPAYTTRTVAADKYDYAKAAVAEFNLNPTNANIGDCEFEFLPIENVDLISRSEAAVPALKVVKSEKGENGLLNVSYTLENPEALSHGTTAAPELPITALKAIRNIAEPEEGDNNIGLENAGSVVSDYFSLVNAQVAFTNLSYVPKTGTTVDSHLATTGKMAIEETDGTNAYNVVNVSYAKTFNLADTIRVCYTQTEFGATASATHKFLSLKEALDDWGLTAKYAMLGYMVGDSNTNESDYGTISAEGVFTPRFVDNGVWKPCVDSEGKVVDGARSALGRHPVVCVTLCKGDKVVLVGYVKMNIVEEINPDQPSIKDYTLVDGTAMPYLCTSTAFVVSTWKDMSGIVLSDLNIKAEEFQARYGAPKDGVFVKDGETYKAVTDCGTLVYNSDKGVDLTNGILTWAYGVDAAGVILEDYEGSVTLYKKFVNKTNENDVVYIGVTVNISPAPSFKFGTLNLAFVPESATDEVGMRVYQVNNGLGKNVTNFDYLLKDYYQENTIVASYDGAHAGYPDEIADLTVNQSYRFADNQKTGFSLDATKTKLAFGATYSDANIVASIDATTGKIVYGPVVAPATEPTEAAKTVLNEGNANYNVFANVQIDATYGTCKLTPAGVSDNVVKVDFRKPVLVGAVAGEKVYYDGVDPTRIPLGAFFTMSDSYGNPLFSFDTETEAYVDAKEIFAYFKIKSVEVELPVVSGIQFSTDGMTKVAGKDNTYTYAAAEGKTLEKVNFLNNCKIVCNYTSGVLERDQLNKVIKVTVKYYWGSQTKESSFDFMAGTKPKA